MRPIDADALLERIKKDPLFPLVEEYGISGVIKAEPTVEAEPKWIPVADRLPKFYETVLVTTKKEEGFEPITVGHFYKNPIGDDIMFDDFLLAFRRCVSTDVLAWMPLPEPYEVKEK